MQELAEAERRVGGEAPLPPRAREGVAVALAREVDPLGVAELVAHEREPRVGREAAREQPRELVQSEAGENVGAAKRLLELLSTS